MRITKVVIENYRSIKNLELVFNSLFGLIGANSAGKSNILRALNLVLGERYPMPQSLSKKDFFNENMQNNILIQVFFDTPFESYREKCKGIQFTTSYHAETNSFNADLKAINMSHECQNWRMNGEAREQIPVLYIPASRNFEFHLQNSSEWSLLGKIIKNFNDIFPLEKLTELNSSFAEVKKILEIPKFKEFEESFQTSFREHVLPNENDIEISFKAFDPKNYYKTISIIPKEYNEIKNIDQMGEGMKNLILISLFRAYAKTFPDATIFLIEEPELYLHPQGRADLFNLFRTLAENGSQIIYTTHSQEFVDLEFFDCVGIVKKKSNERSGETQIIQIVNAEFIKEWNKDTGKDAHNIEGVRQFMKNITNAEINKGFFAKKIVLVEGQTEKWLLPIYAKKLGLNFEKNNIEIVDVSGKSNLLKFWTIFRQFGYAIYVIFDGDKKTNTTASLNFRLTSYFLDKPVEYPPTTIGTNFTVFEENIETELLGNIPNMEQLMEEARSIYGIRKGRNKEICSRYLANNTEPPEFMINIINNIVKL